MSSEDRRLFLVPIAVAGYIAAFLVIAGLYAYLLITTKKLPSWGELIFCLALFLPIALWFCFRGVQVIWSVHRYNERVPKGPS